MNFNTRLKELRLSKGLSQKELADKLNVGRTTVCEYERGKIVPKQEGLLKLASFFNVSIDYLTGVSNVSTTQKQNTSDISNWLNTIQHMLLDEDNNQVTFEGNELSPKHKLYIDKLIQQLRNNIDMFIQLDANITDTELTPKDYDRWDGRTGIKVISKPTKNAKKDTITYSEPDDYFPKEIREKFSDDCGGIQPLEIIEKEEYKRKVELVLQKQRNGEELTDDELDILFEQMSRECANSMTGTHPPTEENK
ncbi:MAG: helix-turn-helix transcriptional regulator [Ruminococcus sp.]|nr:helix-turn-helix transcriptional regulator [Ruminococcus sp.]MCI5597851.1 helix-turn-helix transcriptional regulator [Ruminococcus sp.]